MSFTNPYSTKTAGSSTITASETNAAGVSISRAVDGTNGGTYSPGAAIIVNGANGVQLGSPLNYASGSSITGTGTRTGSMTLSGSGATTRWRINVQTDPPSLLVGVEYDIYTYAAPGAQRDVEIKTTTSPVPTAGQVIWFRRSSSGANAIILHREGAAGAIVTLPASTASSALLVFNGTVWIGLSTDGGTKGADWG
jgi:hypothetical protein